MSLQTPGVWAAGVWNAGVWADCVWYEQGCASAPAPAPAPAPTPSFESPGGGAVSGWQIKHKQRKKIQEEDEEILRMCQMAYFEIIRKADG